MSVLQTGKAFSTSSCGAGQFKTKYQLCLFNIQWTRISLVCSRPACVLLACVGFGQETRANAPSPTSNGCQAPLNVTGWLESREGGGGNRDVQPRRSLSAHAGSSAAEAAKANQMQRELLCATECLVRAGSA